MINILIICLSIALVIISCISLLVLVCMLNALKKHRELTKISDKVFLDLVDKIRMHKLEDDNEIRN